MWLWQDAGRTAFWVLAVVGAVWLALVFALVIAPDAWRRRTRHEHPEHPEHPGARAHVRTERRAAA